MGRHDARTGGFTLIETLVTLAVLVCGIVAAAGLFSYAVSAGFVALERSGAAFLVRHKVETLRLEARGPGVAPGGGLDPLDPAPGYHDYPILSSPWVVDPGEAGPLLRVWEVESGFPVRIRVAVFSSAGLRRGGPALRAHAGATVADGRADGRADGGDGF
jgi:type II secretory pathway pseudopilin PulG